MDQEGVQINKYISASGYCSRREADKLVEQGRVMINDKVAKLTHKVRESDTVSVDFEYIKKKKVQAVYIAMNKPVGITSTTDTKDKTNIMFIKN